MNIFVAGIHGAGKTYLASRTSAALGLLHRSASTLIHEELPKQTWTEEKKVADIDENQRALVRAVRRYNDQGQRLLIDGHFVLLDRNGELVSLPTTVFSGLSLSGVVLLEAAVATVVERMRERNVAVSEASTEVFMHRERAATVSVIEALGLRMEAITSASEEAFTAAVQRLIFGGT